MGDANGWAQKVAGWGCPVCTAVPEAEDAKWLLTLPSGRVLLQDDGDFPGYCILYFRRHVTELFELTSAEQGQLIEDLSRLARAIDRVCRPAKLNYACLGNQVPHLHWHIVPRYPTDGWWGQAFTARPPAECRVMNPGEYTRLLQSLRAMLR